MLTANYKFNSWQRVTGTRNEGMGFLDLVSGVNLVWEGQREEGEVRGWRWMMEAEGEQGMERLNRC